MSKLISVVNSYSFFKRLTTDKFNFPESGLCITRFQGEVMMKINIVGKVRGIDPALYNLLKNKGINLKPNGIIFLPFGQKRGEYMIPPELLNIRFSLIITVKILTGEQIIVFDKSGNRAWETGHDAEGVYYSQKGKIITAFNGKMKLHEVVCDGKICRLKSSLSPQGQEEKK
jgi:hypothetical protein